MMRSQNFHTFVAILAALVFVHMVQPCEATRILEEDQQQWIVKTDDDQNGLLLLLPSFQRGRPTGPPAPSGCTWVGGGGGTPCTASVSNRNFAGHSHLPAAATSDAYPNKQMLRFGIAAAQPN